MWQSCNNIIDFSKLLGKFCKLLPIYISLYCPLNSYGCISGFCNFQYLLFYIIINQYIIIECKGGKRIYICE